MVYTISQLHCKNFNDLRFTVCKILENMLQAMLSPLPHNCPVWMFMIIGKIPKHQPAHPFHPSYYLKSSCYLSWWVAGLISEIWPTLMTDGLVLVLSCRWKNWWIKTWSYLKVAYMHCLVFDPCMAWMYNNDGRVMWRRYSLSLGICKSGRQKLNFIMKWSSNGTRLHIWLQILKSWPVCKRKKELCWWELISKPEQITLSALVCLSNQIKRRFNIYCCVSYQINGNNQSFVYTQ